MMRFAVIWIALGAVLIWAMAVAATSPLLAWRGPVYILGGITGVIGLALLVVQPALIATVPPGPFARRARGLHRLSGVLLLGAVTLHVGGLWITSPPDVVDVLLLRSPTPFGLWGAVAMWAVFATALIAFLRRRFRPKVWRAAHGVLAAVSVGASVLHALLIEGTMGTASKGALCALSALLTLSVMRRVIWPILRGT